MNSNHFPKFFEFFENNLKKNSSQEYIHGDNLTIADFAHLSVYSSMINNGANKDSSMSILEDFPTLKNYYQTRWDAQKEYFDSRPASSF